MSKDHIIPRFILRGFAINPSANKQNHKIMIYDRETKEIKTRKINEAYAIDNFNSPEIESYLAKEYESKVARIFQKISKSVNDNQKIVSLTNAEYKLLFRFFTIMWRRNNIHVDRAKKMGNQIEQFLKNYFGKQYQNMLKAEYKDYTFAKMFDENEDVFIKNFYDKVISETNDNDPTVFKTIKYYPPVIVHNKSNIHFLLHNTYATLRYFIPQGQKEIYESDCPYIMIYPISNTLCFCMIRRENEIDITKDNYDIPIEVWDNDNEMKEFFIDGYITETATSFVVDDTNKNLIN